MPSKLVHAVVLILALAVPAAAFTRTVSAPAGGSLPSNVRSKPTLLRGAAFDGLPDLSPLFSKLSQSAPSSPLEGFPQLSSLSVPGMPVLELSALENNGLTSALSQLVSHVDPALQPLLLAPPMLFALAIALDQWDQIGNGFESGGSLGSSSGSSGSGSGVDAPFRSGSYNEEAASAFYGQRPLVVLKRLLSLASLTSTFNVKLLRDYLVTPKGPDGRKITPWVGENDRAKEALVLASALGPTFIKLGQAASIRTDLIPEPYALELRQLQDAVPPFGDEEAMAVLREQLGVDDLTTIFTSLSAQPVASASIGQVCVVCRLESEVEWEKWAVKLEGAPSTLWVLLVICTCASWWGLFLGLARNSVGGWARLNNLRSSKLSARLLFQRTTGVPRHFTRRSIGGRKSAAALCIGGHLPGSVCVTAPDAHSDLRV